MAFPVILYDNLLRITGATIVASSTESGFPLSNLYDFRGSSKWKSGTLVTGITIDIDLGSDIGSADTLALVNHNITSEVGTIEIRADTSAGPNPPTTVRLAAYTPTYGDVELKTFTLASNLRRWRVVLAKGGNFANKPFFGELWLGRGTTLPEFLSADTDPYLRDTEAEFERAEGGAWLGATLRGQQHRARLSFGGDAGLNRSYLTSTLNDFLHNHFDRRRPFFFQVDSADSELSRPYYLVRAPSGDRTRSGVGGVWNRMTLGLPATEAWMEAP